MLRSAITLTMLLGAVTLVAGPAGAADVYKYTDEKGNVFYTDKPRTLPAERLTVQQKKADAKPAAPSGDESQRAQEADAASKLASTEKASERVAAQSNAKDRAERCTKARDRYDIYLTSQKLYEEKPGGERRYLSSKELDVARADAKASMDVWCK